MPGRPGQPRKNSSSSRPSNNPRAAYVLLNLMAANSPFSDERLELIYGSTNPKRFTVDVDQTIAKPPPAE